MGNDVTVSMSDLVIRLVPDLHPEGESRQSDHVFLRLPALLRVPGALPQTHGHLPSRQTAQSLQQVSRTGYRVSSTSSQKV